MAVSHVRHVSGMRVGEEEEEEEEEGVCAVASAHHLSWTREGDDGRTDGRTGLMGLIYNLCTPKKALFLSLHSDRVTASIQGRSMSTNP